MPQDKIVTIIIPCYNVENYVARAIDSALAQTYLHTEIICVDNNSTDRTLEILHDYRKKYPEKIQVFQELEQGAPAARNLGMRYAKGEWLQFLDADDEILPEKITCQMDLILNSRNPRIGFVVGSYRLIKANGIINILPYRKDELVAWFTSKLGNTVANLWKSSVVKEVECWDLSYNACQEYDLMRRILELGYKPIYDTYISTIVLQRQGSISYLSKAFQSENYRLRIGYLDHLYDRKFCFGNADIDVVVFNLLKREARFSPSSASKKFKQYLPNGYRFVPGENMGFFVFLQHYFSFVFAARVLRLYTFLNRVVCR